VLQEQQRTNEKLRSTHADFEQLWTALDAMFDSLTVTDWQRPHGQNWVLADVPYHLAYFEREVMIKCISRGRAISRDERWLMPSLNAINEWNARMFAHRPADQTVAQSLAELRQNRNELKELLLRRDDSNLGDPVWSPFMGWMTLEDVLGSGIAHTWNHFTEFRLRLKRKEPQLPAALNGRALGFYMTLFEAMADTDKVGDGSFTVVMDFGECGSWTIDVFDGEAHLRSGSANNAHIVMSQEPETFVATFTKVQNPMVAMLTRKIRVKGFRNMSRFGKIFAEPPADQAIFPVNEVEPAPLA
jgi:hypothetical protein